MSTAFSTVKSSMNATTRDTLLTYLRTAEALLDSMNASIRAEEPDNVWKHNSFKIYLRKYNQLIDAVSAVMQIDAIVDRYNIENVPGCNDTIASQQKEYFDSVHVNLTILKSYLEIKLGVKSDRVLSLTDFFQANLRKAIFSEPEREVEIQNAIEQLLIGRGLEKGIDYDRETGRVKISIKEVVPDFILQKLNLAIEVKLSKSRDKSKEIVDEINADIVSYGKKYSSILFIVYDLGTIRDELEFKHDLEKMDGVSVVIVKH